MRYVVTAAGSDNGKIYDVEILAKKINGVWTKWHDSIGFVCYSDIRVIGMTKQEQEMPVRFEPGWK